MPDADRYDRQKYIRGWRQSRLSGARVLVAGAGALGNEIIKNLAMAGMGKILVVDGDTIELSNLSRTVLFRESDIGRSKALTAAEMGCRLNPDVTIIPVQGDLHVNVGLGYYRHADLVVGCLDNLAARAEASFACTLAGTPYLDGGTWDLGGEVRWFFPHQGPCFECTLSAEDRQRLFERRSCSGHRVPELDSQGPPMAATISITAVVAGIMAQEAIRFLFDQTVEPGQVIVYNGMNQTLHRSQLSKNSRCLDHNGPYEDVIQMDRCVASTTSMDILIRADGGSGEAILELGRDFLFSGICPACRTEKPIRKLLRQVDTRQEHCPSCGGFLDRQMISRVGIDDPHAHLPLSALGVPPGDILALRQGELLRLYEFTGDLCNWSVH